MSVWSAEASPCKKATHEGSGWSVLAFALIERRLISRLEAEALCREETGFLLFNPMFSKCICSASLLTMTILWTVHYKAHFEKCWCQDSSIKS